MSIASINRRKPNPETTRQTTPSSSSHVEDGPAESRIQWGLILLLISLPLEWYRVSWIGSKSVTWLALVVVVLSLSIRPGRSLNRLVDFFKTAPYVILFYVCYLATLTCSALWGPDVAEGIAELVRAYSQFFFFLVAGTVLMGASRGSIARSILIGAPIAIIVFIGYCQYVFASQGDSLLTQLATAVSTGQSNAVGSSVLRHIVNHQFVADSQSGVEEIDTAVRNTISVSFTGLLFLTLAFAGSVPKEQRGIGFYGLFLFVVSVTPAVLFVLMSRSNILSILGAPVLCYFVYQISGRGLQSRNSISAAILIVALMGCGVVLLLTAFSDSDFLSLNIQRMQEIGEDVRIEHYRGIVELIEKRPLLGYGLGAETPDGRAVHNLMLGGWFRAGLAGLVFAVLFYIGIVSVWINGSVFAHRIREIFPTHLSVFWFPALLFEPLLRAPLIGGQGGRFIRAEWLMIAVFLVVFASLKDHSAAVDHNEFSPES